MVRRIPMTERRAASSLHSTPAETGIKGAHLSSDDAAENKCVPFFSNRAHTTISPLVNQSLDFI